MPSYLLFSGHLNKRRGGTLSFKQNWYSAIHEIAWTPSTYPKVQIMCISVL